MAPAPSHGNVHSLFARDAWLPEGWARNVRVDIDAAGTITRVQADASVEDAERAGGPLLPGLCDIHSHAFQRAMAGLAEGSAGLHPTDTFWTWRELMYRCVNQLSPGAIERIAAQLFVELLKGGYTSVCEFHYVHRDPDGRPYADPAELALRILSAAGSVGIGITLLPVLYMRSSFDVAAHEGQRRFLGTPESTLAMVQRLSALEGSDVRIGIAPHSLRAVAPDALQTLLQATEIVGERPVHMHAAEQVREVEECVAWSGLRPVEWLLEHIDIDPRWCLVHATHMTPKEADALARTGATAGLCPSTEGNLGDGLFDLPTFLASGGTFGVGTDSNVCTSAAEELRWLEYGQRVAHRRRIIGSDNRGSAGAALYRCALRGGARAAGRPIAGLAVGQRADVVVLDPAHPALAGRTRDAILDAYLFCNHGNPVRDVMAGGRWVVREGRHADEQAIGARYAAALEEMR